ncbi:MAG: DUF4834 family protein [Prevotella sp.]|nr:DUF4834 family protein [Prevotella sp.]
MFLIKFILFIILLGIAAVVGTVLRVWWSIRKMQQKLRRGAESMNQQASGQTTSEGDILTDTRDPERAGRKIIDDDEGEYVDYVEEN